MYAVENLLKIIPLSAGVCKNTCALFLVVPPKSDNNPYLVRGHREIRPLKDLAGPYQENVNRKFSCHIRQVLPGKDSTSFEFYYNGKLRLHSKEGVGKVVESDERDDTKHVTWIFTTSFNRSDNGGNMRCHVNWQEGQYYRRGLKSITTGNVKVRCKCPMIYTVEPLLYKLVGEED